MEPIPLSAFGQPDEDEEEAPAKDLAASWMSSNEFSVEAFH